MEKSIKQLRDEARKNFINELKEAIKLYESEETVPQGSAIDYVTSKHNKSVQTIVNADPENLYAAYAHNVVLQVEEYTQLIQFFNQGKEVSEKVNVPNKSTETMRHEVARKAGVEAYDRWKIFDKKTGEHKTDSANFTGSTEFINYKK